MRILSKIRYEIWVQRLSCPKCGERIKGYMKWKKHKATCKGKKMDAKG